MNDSKIRIYKAASVLLIPLFFFILFLWKMPAAAEAIETISPKQAAELVLKEKGNADFVILDIRTFPEFQTGHLNRAILLDYYSSTFVEGLKQLDKNKIYLVYCRSGNRSGKALALFNQLGFEQVYNMAEGINGWIRAGFPMER